MIDQRFMDAEAASYRLPEIDLQEPAPEQQVPEQPIQLAMGGGGRGQKAPGFAQIPGVVGGALMDIGASTAKGMTQGFLGTPGDIEMIGRGVTQLIGTGVEQILSRGGSETLVDAFLRGLKEKTILPTSEDVKKFLDERLPLTGLGVGTDSYGTIGEIVSPGGQIKVVKAAIKGAKAIAPDVATAAANVVERGLPGLPGSGFPIRGLNVVEPGPGLGQMPVLDRQERAAITAGAGRKKQVRDDATRVATEMKANYPEADGWTPIEITKVEPKFDKKTGKYIKVEVTPKAIAYDFHTAPEGVPPEAWQATLSSRVVDEVQSVVDRAASGDQAAINILAEASWYRTMRDRLRTEFGGLGDVFADVLGTTSAQTDVRQNFKNAVTVLRKFSRGDYDKTLAAYEARVAKGQPVDAKTLSALDSAGEFDLIKSDAGKLFNTNSPATMGALLDLFRNIKAGDSPKTPNFTGNLIGLTNEATIDVWAARMLRRVADLPRIPPPAEKGVAGSHMKGSTLFNPKVSSEFGFGQDVFREAADEINKSGAIKNVAPDIGDLGPDDLQAVAWFIEKERWTQSGWTTKAGEGGSLDYEMSLAGAADQARIGDLRKGINAGFQPPAMRVGESLEMRDTLPRDPNLVGPPLPPFVGPYAYPGRVDQARQIDIANKNAMREELVNSKAPVDRYTLGVSGERPNQPMSNYGQAELASEFDDVVRNNEAVLSYNLSSTYGSFMGQTERALNAEFVARQDFNPTALERRLVEQGKAYDQDAVFISKVVKNGTVPNARPGVEIYFKEKITPDQMAVVTAKLRQYGVDGFTYVTDMRFNDRINVQARAGGADTAGLNGLRFQYIPEFDDGFNAANRAKIMQGKEDIFQDIVDDIIKEGNVSDARVVFYDTKVYFKGGYDEYLTRTVGQADQPQGGAKSSGANVTQPDRSGEVGQDFSRTVSDRLRKKTAASKSSRVNQGGSAQQSGAE